MIFDFFNKVCYNDIIRVVEDDNMIIKQLTNEEFTEFANNYEQKSIYQTKEYAFIMNKQNFESIFLGLIDNNQVIAASIFLIEKLDGFKYAYAPRGFLLDYSNTNILKEFTNGIKSFLGKLNVIAVKINPLIIKNIYNSNKEIIYTNPNFDNIFSSLKKLGYYHLGYNNGFESLKPRYEAIIDLNKPYYEIFANIKKEYRTKIRSADRNGITIYKGNQSSLKYLYLETQNKYPRDLRYYEDCYFFFNKSNKIDFYYAKLDVNHFLKNLQLKYQLKVQESEKFNHDVIMTKNYNSKRSIAKKISLENQASEYRANLINATNIMSNNPNGVVVASILTIKYDDTIYMMMDGHDPKYKRFNSKHLLIWKLIEKYAKEGYKKFNIGGLPNILVDDNLKGLTQFKLNFGAYINEYIGDLELITNNSLYFIYRNARPLGRILRR
ncbi:MAG: aminoacyltransferase [Bacilli bacterium]|nr:aminoacyltransferase [Bacilli bacterium]